MCFIYEKHHKSWSSFANWRLRKMQFASKIKMYRIAYTKLRMYRLHTRFFTQKARFHGAVYVYCSFKSSFVSRSLAHLSYLVNLGFKGLANPTQIKGKSMFYFLICYKRVISGQRLNSMTMESAINGAKHFINHHFVQNIQYTMELLQPKWRINGTGV